MKKGMRQDGLVVCPFLREEKRVHDHTNKKINKTPPDTANAKGNVCRG